MKIRIDVKATSEDQWWRTITLELSNDMLLHTRTPMQVIIKEEVASAFDEILGDVVRDIVLEGE